MGHAPGELWGLAWHPSKLQYVTASDDMTIRVWDVAKKKQLMSSAQKKPVRSAAWSPDGNHIACGFLDGRVYLFQATDLRLVARKKHCREEISDVKFSPDGSKLAVGSHDNYVDIYTVPEMKRIGRCKGHSSFITHLDWSDDSKFIQTNSGDYEHLYWQGDTGRHLTRAAQLQGAEWATWTSILGPTVSGMWPPGSDNTDINSVDRSKSEKILATADDFGMVKLFVYPCGGTGAPFDQYAGHSSHVTQVRFSHDDSYLVSTGGNDMSIFQWKVQ